MPMSWYCGNAHFCFHQPQMLFFIWMMVMAVCVQIAWQINGMAVRHQNDLAENCWTFRFGSSLLIFLPFHLSKPIFCSLQNQACESVFCSRLNEIETRAHTITGDTMEKATNTKKTHTHTQKERQKENIYHSTNLKGAITVIQFFFSLP